MPAELGDALQEASRRGAKIASVCTGAFVLADAGLLDGCRAMTHWMYARAQADRFSAVEVEAGVLYVVDASIATSAGTATGLDLWGELVRHDHGTAVASELARRLVVPRTAKMARRSTFRRRCPRCRTLLWRRCSTGRGRGSTRR